MSGGRTCEGPACTGLSTYSDTEGCFIWLQHKAVAQAVWKPEKYKETSHTTCCHYDNQAESFSLISCHSTQHRNPIAFKSYATRPPIRSARLLAHLQIRFVGAYVDFCGYLWGCFILEGAPAAWREFGVQGGAALTTCLDLLVCFLVPFSTKFASVNSPPPPSLWWWRSISCLIFYLPL